MQGVRYYFLVKVLTPGLTRAFCKILHGCTGCIQNSKRTGRAGHMTAMFRMVKDWLSEDHLSLWTKER